MDFTANAAACHFDIARASQRRCNGHHNVSLKICQVNVNDVETANVTQQVRGQSGQV
jgi:hypothetical protein